jgi:hypothetical protein
MKKKITYKKIYEICNLKLELIYLNDNINFNDWFPEKNYPQKLSSN